MHEANNGFNADLLWSGEWGGEREALEETNKKEEYLMLSQGLTKTISLANQEWNESVVLEELASVGVNESLRVELFRSVPVIGVVHDPGDISVDWSSRWQLVTMELHILGGGVRNGVVETGVPQHLVDEGVSVGHVVPVLQGGAALSKNFLNLLNNSLLDVRISDHVEDGEGEDSGGCL